MGKLWGFQVEEFSTGGWVSGKSKGKYFIIAYRNKSMCLNIERLGKS